jgi:hypothetical protein
MKIELRNPKELQEKLLLKNWRVYLELVSKAYLDAPVKDEKVVPHWEALNKSNYTWFKRLLSRVDLSFYTIFEQDYNSRKGKIFINDKEYKLELITPEEEYPSATVMRNSFRETNKLRISIDYSSHPYFAPEGKDITDNLVFRTVHDFIVHIQGDHEFGDRGEMASYNLHAKLCPPMARPALFTEIVGQVGCAVITGDFPEQKVAVLEGFDYLELGKIDDENYEIVNKELVKKENSTLEEEY